MDRTLNDLWHYPRPELAKSYLDMLNTGLITTTTIFAPRRTGKTWFLLKDLKPAAERAGYRVVYADLWQTNRSPATALARALDIALEPHRWLDKIAARLKMPVKTIRGRAEIAGARVEGELALDAERKPITEVALQLDAQIESLTAKAPLLILVDEAQAMARSQAGEDFARALRTAITTRPQRLRTVFTGSSRTGLGHVFGNAHAPLFSAGSGIQQFPLLDDRFVEYIGDRFHASTGRTLDIALAKDAFVQFGQRPEPLVRAVLTTLLDPSVALSQAIANIHAELTRQENHEGTWQTLDATERALVRMIAADVAVKPFSGLVLNRLRAVLGIDDLNAHHVQSALGRLATKSVVGRTPRGVFEFENEHFAQWVRDLAE